MNGNRHEKRRNIWGYFVSYCSIAMIFVFLSFFITNGMVKNMQNTTRDTVRNRFYNIVKDIDNQYRDLTNNSIQLANRSEFTPNHFLNSEVDTLTGLSVLADLCRNNRFIYDAFMYYGNNRVYSAKKVSDISIHFESVLGCTTESGERAIRALETKESHTLLLRTKIGGGYIMLIFPEQRSHQISVNYCIDVSALAELFSPMLDSVSAYFCFSFSDGEKIYFSGNSTDGVYSIQEADYPNTEQQQNYTVIRESSDIGIEFETLCRTDVLYQQIRKWQVFNAIILLIELFVVIFVSFIMSNRRYERLKQLENSISGRMSNQDSVGEFNYVNSLVQNIVSESENWQHNADLAQTELRVQVANQLFRGLFTDSDALNHALNACGSTVSGPYYAVCCLIMRNQKLSDDAEEILRTQLYYPAYVQEYPAFYVLMELPDMDYLRKHRRQRANQFIQQLNICSPTDVQLVLSQVRDNLNTISFSFGEVRSLCGQPILEDTPQFRFCEDQLEISREFVQLEQKQTAVFTDAVQSCSVSEIISQFSHLNQYISNCAATEENKRYLRFCLLQILVLAIRNNEKVNREVLLPLSAHVDVTNSVLFENNMKMVIQQYCEQMAPEAVDFQTILNYVYEHYSDVNLSLGEVASFAGVTAPYLSKLFKVKTDLRYIDFLSKIRMEKARELLLRSDMPIHKIMLSVGYIDKASFSRKFKAYFGSSAQDMRIKNTSGEKNSAIESDLPFEAESTKQ